MSTRKSKVVGCLFPMCACIESNLGCAHEPYDMKRPHNDGEQYDTQLTFKWWDHRDGVAWDDVYEDSYGG